MRSRRQARPMSTVVQQPAHLDSKAGGVIGD
jgi:hypothetical protein